MEVIKKRIAFPMTTGTTSVCTGCTGMCTHSTFYSYYVKYGCTNKIIKPNLDTVFHMTIGLSAVGENVGFFDAYLLNDAYDYIELSGATTGITQQNIANFMSFLTGGTTLEASGLLPYVHNNGGYLTGDTSTHNSGIVTGGTTSRLIELRKYTITNNFNLQYISGGTPTVDGVDYANSSSSNRVVYYIGGIRYLDVYTGNTTGTTFSFNSSGYASPNFINVPYYQNPNKENIISQPNIDDDVFIIRQESSAFEGNYRLEYIKNLSDLMTYAGGNYFKIITNS
jgi:hypothetical protein